MTGGDLILERVIGVVRAAAESQSCDSQAVIVHLATTLEPFLERGAWKSKSNAAFAHSQGKRCTL